MYVTASNKFVNVCTKIMLKVTYVAGRITLRWETTKTASCYNMEWSLSVDCACMHAVLASIPGHEEKGERLFPVLWRFYYNYIFFN